MIMISCQKICLYFCTDVNLCQLIVLPKETEEQKKSNAKTGPYIIISHILTIGRRLVTVTSVVELELAEVIQLEIKTFGPGSRTRDVCLSSLS